MAAARVREACGIPGTSVHTTYLCRDKPAMKEALRAAGVPCARSAGTAERPRRPRLRRRRRLPDHPQAGRRCRRIGRRARQLARRARRGDRPQRRRPWRRGRRRGVRRRPRGLLRHDHHRRPRRRRLRHALLPQRARSDADALDLAAVHHDQPHRCPELRRAARTRPAGHHRPRHRHVGDAHGMVRRAQGSVLLGDRRPPTWRAGLGPLRRRQRLRHLPRVGQRHRPRATWPVRRRDSSPPG